MFERIRADRTSTRTPARSAVADIRIDRPEGPIIPHEPHPIDRRLAAEQDAIGDHAAGGLDEIYFLNLDGQLPFEDKIDTETRRLQSDSRQRRLDAELLAAAFLERIKAVGVRGLGLVQLVAIRTRAVELREQVRDWRTEHSDVLHGVAEDGSGRNRTGPVPHEANYLLWRLRAAMISVVIVILEIVALYAVFAYTLAADNPADIWHHPEIAATSLLGAAVVVMVPILLGMMLRGVYRNAEHRPLHTAGRVFQFLLIGAMWLVAVWLMAQARAETFSAQTTTSLNPAGEASATGLALLMFVIFTLLGLATMWYHARHNWHADEVVRYNALERKLDRQIDELTRQIEATQAQVAIQENVLQIDERAWTEHIDVTLPAIGEEVKAHYRTELIRRMGDPLLTGAIGTTASSAALAEEVPEAPATSGAGAIPTGDDNRPDGETK